MRVALILLVQILANTVYCQMIDNTVVYRNMSTDRGLRFHYENDYFSKTDIYYTQGINLELVHPSLKKFPLSRLLIQAPGQETKYGIGAEHLGFTPTSISSQTILREDRPFAGCLMFNLFSATNDSIRKYRIASAITVGVIGPMAGASEFQSAIHRWINDEEPLGWNNQIRNDLILNYQADISKGLINYKNIIMLAGKVRLRGGTFNTKLSGGLLMMTGLFSNPWKYFTNTNRNFQIYLYEEPLVSLVGHDATLQGGIFNSSPYTISASELQRVVFQNNAGLVIQIRKIYLEYFQSYLSKEFKTGGKHYWGGVRIGLQI
jgi:hypothetical protein